MKYRILITALILSFSETIYSAQSSSVPPTEEEQPILFVGAPEESEEDSSKNSNLSDHSGDEMPLLFDPLDNQVIIAKQSIDYDLTQAHTLRVGPYELKSDSVEMILSRERAYFRDVEFGIEVRKRLTYMYFLSFKWPVDYLREGTLELIDDAHNVIWRKQVSVEDTNSWRDILEKKKPALSSSSATAGVAATQIESDSSSNLGVHSTSSFGVWGQQFLEIPVWKLKRPVRFCLSVESKEGGRLALCSKRYRFVRSGGRYHLSTQRGEVRPRVLVNDREVTLKGSAIFLDEVSPIKFSSILGNGTYFEFIAAPKPVKIIDMVLNAEKNRVEVIGYGNNPMQKHSLIDRNGQVFWNFLNFKPTIGDLKDYWQAEFSAQEPFLYLRGSGGVPFKQTFIFDQLPTKSARVFVKKNERRSTYSRVSEVYGRTAAEVQISSEQVEAKKTSETDFTWRFLAENRGELNRSQLLVQEKDMTFKAYHELYKGYPFELSARTTGVLSNELQVIILAEAAAQVWFESLLGWENYYVGKQRWGVSAKYFKALTSFGGNSDEDVIKLEVTSADLKYRLNPGVWGRDPTIGFSLNAQEVVLEQFTGQMAGAGAFWARSMPKIFDDMFNIIPFLRYPKWVDVEFIYYPLALNANNVIFVNFALNFHGKIQWTNRFFGEAGFGLKSFQFGDVEANKVIGLGVAYGTVGLGFNF